MRIQVIVLLAATAAAGCHRRPAKVSELAQALVDEARKITSART